MLECIGEVHQKVCVLRITALGKTEGFEALIEATGIDVAKAQNAIAASVVRVDFKRSLGQVLGLGQELHIAARHQKPFEVQRMRQAADRGDEVDTGAERRLERATGLADAWKVESAQKPLACQKETVGGRIGLGIVPGELNTFDRVHEERNDAH